MKNENELQMRYDSDLFSTRLCELMVDKGMVDKKGNPDFAKLYTALYSDGNTDNGEGIPMSRTDYNQVGRAQKNWINGTSKPKTWGDMAHLCNVLECDMDYLMGCDTEYASSDEEFVCQYLGLSRNVISKLHDMALYSQWDGDGKCPVVYPGKSFFGSDAGKEIMYMCISQNILKGIELIFENRSNIDPDGYPTSDYSIIFDLIENLCKTTAESIDVTKYTDDEYYSKYFKNNIPNTPDYKVIDKNGIRILESKENGEYEDISIDMSEYHQIGFSDTEGSYFYVDLADIIDNVTREKIMDLIKDLYKQMKKEHK